MYNFGGYQTQQESEEKDMVKEAEMMTKHKGDLKRNTFITGTVKDLIDIAKIGDGEVKKIFSGKVTTRNIGEEKGMSRTRFSIEISSQIPPEKKNVKEVVLKKIVGERKNAPKETFELFHLKLHKKQLDSKARMEEISKMPHFEKTRELLLRGMGSTEWDLIGIENKLQGARSLGDQIEVKATGINF